MVVVVQADYEERRMKMVLKEEQLAFLRDQIEQQKRATKEWTAATTNMITNEFYEKFGKDHR